MGKVIAIANQKGGVAKTTTTVNLGANLAELGKKVLILDSDPQGNATSGIGIDKYSLEGCFYDVLINGEPVEDHILSTQIPGLDVVPATLQLAGAEVEMVSLESREYRVRRALEPVRDRYDYILIDCPPSLGLLTVNAFTAADTYLIPVQCEYYALEGLSLLLRTLDSIRKSLNPDLQLEGALLTMYDNRTNLSDQVKDEIYAYFKDKMFRSVIPRNIRLAEAPSYGLPISLYDPKSKGAQAYYDLAKEVMANG